MSDESRSIPVAESVRVALFSGSRDWTNENAVVRAVAQLPDDCIVVHGDAPGLDRMAGRIAKARGLHVAAVPALWERYGKPAGYRRNAAMLWLRPDVLHAFPMSGSGTQMMIELADKAGVEVVVHMEMMDMKDQP